MIEKEQDQQQDAVIQGPGQMLKQARERANLSCQDIADKIKLKKALIEDIEQDNYDINLALTFIRGYLKLYAKHVQVDEIEVVNAFEKLNTQKKEPAKLQSFSRRVANQANDDKLMLVTYLIVAVVIALVVIWWFQQSTTTASSNVTETTPQGIVTHEALPLETTLTADNQGLATAASVADIPMNGSDTIPEALFPPVIADPITDIPAVAREIVDNTDNLATLEDSAETAGTGSPALVELIFEFSGDCWMNLSDATGENIAYGVKVKDRVMPVSGIPPFVVTLGAPEVVKIHYAGQPIDMSFLPSGRIAKFDLPLSD